MATNGQWGPAMRLIGNLHLEEFVLGQEGQRGEWLRCDHLDRCDPPPTARRFEPAMAAWILDQAEGDVDEECCEMVGDRLVFSNQERARLWAIISVYRRIKAEWDGAGVATCKRLASSDVFRTSIELIRAVDKEQARLIEARVEVLAETGLAPDPLVGGGDLLAAGLAAGPEMGEILEAVYDAQLEGRLLDRGSAIEMALKLVQGHPEDH